MQNKNEHSSVQLHSHSETFDQTKNIIALIQKESIDHPEHTIAILVRSRAHLINIIPALKNASIAFNAIEIESLQHQPLIYDLIALTTALLHLNNRVAWLAILRAPWCGLCLHDLHALFGENHHSIIWEVLQAFEQCSNLSDEGKTRLRHIVPILMHSLNQRQRLPLRMWVEQTWKALNGITCLMNAHELEISKVFFSILEETELSNDLFDIASFTQKLHKKFATAENNLTNKLTLMTIHKSKGLEFDTIIVPHLEAKGKNEQERLLRWLDRPRLNSPNDLLLAPIKSKTETEDAIYRYLHLTETQKIQYEMARLLYVATTRAKKKLHLLANFNSTNTDKPSKNSFLSLLHIHFTDNTILSNNDSVISHISDNSAIQSTYLRRLPLQEITKNARISHEKNLFKIPTFKPHDTDSAENHRLIGIIIHRILEKISLHTLNEWTEEKILKEQTVWKKWLLLSGASNLEVEQSLSIITQMITRTLHDSRGQWILKHRAEQSNELKITTVVNHKPLNLIIDRTFIDDHVRWIIDYKTSLYEGDEVDAFLDEMQNIHTQQMQMYALAFEKIDIRPIRLGLYFPAFGGWREWNYVRETHAAKSHSF